MQDPAPDMPADPDLPGSISPDRVDELLREHWGLSGQMFPVEESRGSGYLVDNGHMRYLVEIRETGDEAELRLEHEVMRHIIRSPDGPPVPEPVSTKDGLDILTAEIDGQERLLRLLTALDGDPPPPPGELSDEAILALATISAGLARSLEDFDQHKWHDERADDLRRAGPQTVSLLSQVNDQEIRDLIARAMVSALRRIHPLTPAFRLGLTVQDLALPDLSGTGTGKSWVPSAISDLAGLSRSWHVAALAKTCARILAHNGGAPSTILPAVAAYHEINPLNVSEAEALWPMVIVQLALSAATAENHHALSPGDVQAGAQAETDRATLNRALTVETPFMNASIIDACGLELPEPDLAPLLPGIDPDRIRLVDLGIASPLFYDGNWTDPDCDWKLLARVAWDTGMGSTRYGEYRLSRTSTDGKEPENFALHVDVCLPAGTPLQAPFGGKVIQTSPQLCLRGPAMTLLVEGARTTVEEGTELASGEFVATVAGEEGAVGGLRLRLSRDAEMLPPLFCQPSTARIWRHLAPSPSALLGIEADAPPVVPNRTARGWHEFLYDETGRVSLDFSGRAALIGHGHPAVATVAYRRHLLSATIDGGESETTALQQALVDIAPAGLENVVLFAGQRDAMEAIARFARHHTGRQRISGLDEEDGMDSTDPDRESDADIAAFIVEPFGEKDGLPDRLTTARRDGSLIVADERRSGYGRMGDTFWAVDRDGLQADLLLAGSCDGSGIAVIFCRTEHATLLQELSARVSPVDAATAHAALGVLIDEGLQANAAKVGQVLGDGLRSIGKDANGLLEVAGEGLFWSMQPSGESARIFERLEDIAVHYLGEPGRLSLIPPLCLSEAGAQLYIRRLRHALELPDR